MASENSTDPPVPNLHLSEDDVQRIATAVPQINATNPVTSISRCHGDQGDSEGQGKPLRQYSNRQSSSLHLARCLHSY